jgi:hypothetical protein
MPTLDTTRATPAATGRDPQIADRLGGATGISDSTANHPATTPAAPHGPWRNRADAHNKFLNTLAAVASTAIASTTTAIAADWPAVLDGARAMMAVAVGEPTSMDTCERACREADRKAAARPRDPELERLLDDRVTLADAWEALNGDRPTPEVTVEAVKQAVRDRGVVALREPSIRDRLQRCDADAHKRFDLWLTDFKKRLTDDVSE